MRGVFVSFYILLSLLEACEGDSGLPVVLDSETPEKVVAVYVAGSDSNIGACGVLPGSKGIAEKLTHPVINFWISNFPKIWPCYNKYVRQIHRSFYLFDCEFK